MIAAEGRLEDTVMKVVEEGRGEKKEMPSFI